MGLTRIIARKVSNYNNPDSLGSRFRRQRFMYLFDLINSAYERYGHVNIIDIGGRRIYWNNLSVEEIKRKKITVTIVNLSNEESYSGEGFFKHARADGCNLSNYEDKSFHIAHSNSVIEHVGDWDRMSKFASEVSRVSRSYFVQTPHYWFPVEPHLMTPFFHWLPEPFRISLVTKFDLGDFKKQTDFSKAVRYVECRRLLDKRMFSFLFKEAEIITEWFLLFPKSMIAIKREEN